MNSMEDFDKRVERFLKKQLTHEEELAFIEALKADKALLERAKTWHWPLMRWENSALREMLLS